MRTTITIDDALIEEARRVTGVEEKSALLHRGLETLIRVESAKRLAALGGNDKKAKAAPRDRSSRS